ncbi:MAG: FG-GAP repeat domain-containing protein [Fidelibacterota bacterium]
MKRGKTFRGYPFLAAGLLISVLGGEVRFTDITGSSGLSAAIHGEGVCVFDVNRDGFEDIAIADYDGGNLLYENLGEMTFREVSQDAGIARDLSARLVVAGDYDNDGHPDLFLGAIEGSSILYRNRGDGTFSDVTDEAGVVITGDVRGGAWGDVDRDGLLDLYVARLHEENLLYRNNGDGTFTEAAASLGATGPASTGLVMGLAFLDFDLDGDDDLFMTQDGNKGNILLRWDVPGGYTDISQSAGVRLPVQGMGVAVGDYNRDGLFDVYTTNLDENTLLENMGDGTFRDVSSAAAVEDEPGSMSWGTFFFDADNDGWLDLFSHNQTGFGQVPNSFFHNRKDGTFAELSAQVGLEIWNDGIGSAYGDLDNDGDLDLVLAGGPTEGNSLMVMRNDSDPSAWTQVSLEGTESNRSAAGAVVRLYSPGGSRRPLWPRETATAPRIPCVNTLAWGSFNGWTRLW